MSRLILCKIWAIFIAYQPIKPFFSALWLGEISPAFSKVAATSAAVVQRHEIDGNTSPNTLYT